MRAPVKADLMPAVVLLVLISGSVNYPLGGIEFFHFYPGLLLTLLIVAVWLMRVNLTGAPTLASRLNLPIVLFFSANLISVALSYIFWDPGVGSEKRRLVVQLAEVALTVAPLLTALAIANTLTTMTRIRRLYYCALALTGAYLVTGFIDFRPTEAWWMVGDKTRVFGNLIPAGPLLLLIFMPIAYSHILMSQSRRSKLAYGALLAGGLVWALYTPKVSFWLAIVVSLLAVSFFHSKRLGIMALVSALAVLPLFSGMISQFYLLAVRYSDFDRLAVWSDSIHIFSKSPLFGVGPGNYWSYMLRYGTIRYAGVPYGSAHSQYLGILAQTGLVGLLAFAWVIGAFIRTGWEARRDAGLSAFEKALVTGWLGSFIGLLFGNTLGDMMLPFVHNDGSGLINYTIYYWIFAGLILALAVRPGDGPVAAAGGGPLD